MPHQRARIDIPNYRYLVALQIRLHRFFRTPIRRQAREFTHNERLDVRTRSFFIVRVGAHISDVGISHANNLSCVAWIGENFLVSGEAGIENDFASAAGLGSRAAAIENSPVLKRKHGGLSGLVGQCILLNLF